MTNLKDFVKIGGNEHMTHLRHKDGHDVILNHKTLEPDVHKAVMQHFDDGGVVLSAQDLNPSGPVNIDPTKIGMEPVQANPAPQDISAQINQAYAEQNAPADASSLTGGLGYMKPQPQAEATPSAAPSMSQPVGAIKQVGLGLPNNMDPMLQAMNAEAGQYMGGLSEQKRGLEQEAAAQGAQGNAEASAYSEKAGELNNLQNSYQSHMQDINQERDNLVKDIQGQHVDPERFWKEQSLPGKISKIIGLAIGGMGAGVTGGPNMAAQMLQKHIDNDINSQRQDIETKNTLLNANRQKFQNENEAVSMTRAMMNDSVSNQIAMQAAQIKDPMAKARLLQMKGQLDQNSAQMVGQMAMRRAVMQGAGSGQISPEMTIRMLVPQQEQGEANKELATAQGMAKGRDSLLSGFDIVSKQNTPGNRAMHPFQSSSIINSAWEPNLAQLIKDSEGRITPADTPMINAFKPKMTDDQKTLNFKRQRLLSFVNQKMNFPKLKGYNIPWDANTAYTSGGQSRFAEGAPILNGLQNIKKTSVAQQ